LSYDELSKQYEELISETKKKRFCESIEGIVFTDEDSYNKAKVLIEKANADGRVWK